MSKTLAPPAPPLAKDVRYTEKTDIIKRIRKATVDSIRSGVPVTLLNEVMDLNKVEDLLSLNQKNRDLSINKVGDHALKMKTGKWRNIGDNLNICRPEDEDDLRLLNGQHRLNAFKSAALAIEERNKELKKEGKPPIVIMWNIVCGLDPDDMSVIDTQKRRTAADWAKFAGHTNANNLVTAVKLVILLRKGKVAGRVAGEMVGTDDVQAFLSNERQEKKIVGYVTTAVNRYRKEAKHLTPAQWTALHFTLSERTGNSKEADEFIEKLVTGDKVSSTSPKTSAIFYCRKLLQNATPEPKQKKVKGVIRANPQDITFIKFYYISKAWNKFVGGRLTTEQDIQLNKEDKAAYTLPTLQKIA